MTPADRLAGIVLRYLDVDRIAVAQQRSLVEIAVLSARLEIGLRLSPHETRLKQARAGVLVHPRLIHLESGSSRRLILSMLLQLILFQIGVEELQRLGFVVPARLLLQYALLLLLCSQLPDHILVLFRQRKSILDLAIIHEIVQLGPRRVQCPLLRVRPRLVSRRASSIEPLKLRSRPVLFLLRYWLGSFGCVQARCVNDALRS